MKERAKQELPKTYEPAAYEDAVYAAWEKSGAFKPASDSRKKADKERRPYSIIMPPPNVTDRLHSGHAIMLALEDALTRYHRKRGFDTLYLPGTDHAAIATAAQVDKQLAADGKTRHDLGRADFEKRTLAFAMENKKIIEDQVRAMGTSCDWSRNAFTLDPPRKAAVAEAFKRLFKKGLIYRGSYMVNWCPTCRTVLADDEVVYKEQEGVLYYMKYGPFTLGTTRPETKVGDTAVAVHPKDKRYAKWVGKEIEVKTINGPRTLRVLADEMVDPEFGTGVVKITPFHDKNDYAVYERRPKEAGPPLEVIGEDGKMTEAAGPKLAGLDRFAARKKMVDWLKHEKLLVKKEVHKHSVGRCYRSDDVIEPRISEQWFLKVSDIKKQAARFARDGDLKFVPQRFEKTYLDWLEKLHDWCISRQVWFGHPVPAYVNAKGEVSLTAKPGFKKSQDTLDTWFSSALWPFSTMGWPKQTAPDFKRFFPNDVLETGYDIIFFWITRMVLMTVALDVKPGAGGGAGKGALKPPFHTAYLHGLVRDQRGRKFSKSLGNGVDPLEMIGKYGADALRWMLVTSSSPGNDLKFDEARLVKSRNFANKIWNISRFVTDTVEGEAGLGDLRAETLTTFDRGILHKLYRTAQTVEAAFHDPAAYDKPGKTPEPATPKKLAKPYDLGFAGNALYEFIWSDFADWYLEAAKVQLRNDEAARNTGIILKYVLETILGLLHPFMPFLTEVIWRDGLGKGASGKGSALITSPWPAVHGDLDQPEDGARFDRIREVIETIRRIRAEHQTPAASFVQAYVVTDEPDWIAAAGDVITKLARVSILRVGQNPPTGEVARAAVGDATVVVPLAGLASDAAAAHLQREVEAKRMEIERFKERLANEDYVENAPEHVVAETKAQLAEAEAALAKLEAS
ncbi:MAG: valine--tRNA ligase [bacterium]|nr:valine--tRNA ligase [bacterium]